MHNFNDYKLMNIEYLTPEPEIPSNLSIWLWVWYLMLSDSCVILTHSQTSSGVYECTLYV